jgi:hypothetical protein
MTEDGNPKAKRRAKQRQRLQRVAGAGLGGVIKAAAKGATKAGDSHDMDDLLEPAFPQWGAAVGYALARKKHESGT